MDIAILNPSEAKAQVAAGKLRYMGVAHPVRLKPFPDWPTFREQGFAVVYGLWRGICEHVGPAAQPHRGDAHGFERYVVFSSGNCKSVD